jgi:hypothetical protein
LLGDDYEDWPGVTQAADDFARENGLVLMGQPGKFLLAKQRSFLPSVMPAMRQGL